MKRFIVSVNASRMEQGRKILWRLQKIGDGRWAFRSPQVQGVLASRLKIRISKSATNPLLSILESNLIYFATIYYESIFY